MPSSSAPTENSRLRGEGCLNELTECSVRHGFIRKVYGVLGMQLLATTLFSGSIMRFGKSMSPGSITFLMFASLAMSVAMMCVFICKPELMRRTPTNYMLLALFTLAKSVAIGFICMQYKTESVLIAMLITCIVVLGLTIFSFQTKYDFTGFGPYLFCGCLVLMGFGFTMSIAQWCGASGPAFGAMSMMYSACGALLFSAYLVYDTQLIVGGKHKNQFSIDDYAFAAISLYIDIIQLFLHILQLMGNRRN